METAGGGGNVIVNPLQNTEIGGTLFCYCNYIIHLTYIKGNVSRSKETTTTTHSRQQFFGGIF
jgi:hypothetical protein